MGEKDVTVENFSRFLTSLADSGRYYKLGSASVANVTFDGPDMRDQIVEITDNYIHNLETQHQLSDCSPQMKDRLPVQPEIQASFIELPNLRIAQRATYDAEEELIGCLEGTRIHLLRRIAWWGDLVDSKRIYWLCGKAGTGKSTLAYTVADKLNEQRRPGGKFFPKRGEHDRGHAKRLFPTIAGQLARQIPGFGDSVAHAPRSEPDLCEKNLRKRFEWLLERPLARAVKIQTTFISSLVIVIDALDECEPQNDVQKILGHLARLEQVRIFVTSRPELPVQLGFGSFNDKLHQDVLLKQAQSMSIQQYLITYLTHNFRLIRDENARPSISNVLPLTWPGEATIRLLAERAEPLFIYAATVCRWVRGDYPESKLDCVLQLASKKQSLTGMDELYDPIISQMINFLKHCGLKHNAAMSRFRLLIGSIVLLADPLFTIALSSLLKMPFEDIRQVLLRLQALLHVPDDHSLPVRLLHLSFRDFLINAKASPFYVETTEVVIFNFGRNRSIVGCRNRRRSQESARAPRPD
ncbi:hypothetical protein K461DRAFT_296144 [Myriangium duriaei CBS 260.36]|uniref:Nephrocystin 3-like N-terminal domain-containing protein n=1 Tax=Myriangium duriaei CBS 260.36 TaxID=1168546 RepID=A0A9P4MJE2_9PEZI|nr:hypothetical protein K461DRAFT_296144 [Myriangium duriaei CBS 260.36]